MATNTMTIQLIITSNCQKCIEANRAVTRTLNQLQKEYPFEVEELDLLDHPELAARYGIWSTPALVVNGVLAGVGRIDATTLREHLAAAQATQEVP